MKVTMNIECTPEEARQFLGLPNVAGMQDKMMKEMERKIQENLQNLDPETFIQTWMPATMQNWNAMQKMFWDHVNIQEENAADEKKSKG